MCQIVDSWTEEPKVVSINRQIIISLQKALFFSNDGQHVFFCKTEEKQKNMDQDLSYCGIWPLCSLLESS